MARIRQNPRLGCSKRGNKAPRAYVTLAEHRANASHDPVKAPAPIARPGLSVLLLLLLLSACSLEASDVDVERDRALSWSKTVEMIANEWGRGSIPTHYAEHASSGASDALHEILTQTRDEVAGNAEAARQLDPIAVLSGAADSFADAVA